ncbi:MAG TPA: 1-(5-phosphoribosyl)-5-[(5-phosphoribosylamino)methylideneamino]imidazole-4-carboxamide isomerase [Verrucomicrobiae bacterium]|mgnify:CR=1 FL=1|nr:1-(5-phosphoribosyl)-5-[(5-phosphoribosylamino)methylideneamino]imidazole-4-carboxamide isomerase [Verrucomicrobiae bacterium]
MIILPAIDIMGGRVVRLRQGRREDVTVYGEDPAAFALRWRSEGAGWLHVVDLDGAFEGTSRNLASVRRIVETAGIPCELGGGLRDEAAVAAALDAGVARAIIGSKAAGSIDFIADLVARFGGERIAVGIDARDGMVAISGWTETSGIRALDLARQATDAGARTIIYTDIATDGMLAGPNVAAMRAMCDAVGANVIASGGVSTPADITALQTIPRLYGAIVGKALYDGHASLPDMLRAARGNPR